MAGYDGPCREIHGHSYKLFVTVRGIPEQNPNSPKFVMVMDFGDLKRIVNDHIIEIYDHSLILRESAPIADEIAKAYQRVITVPFQPTCENLVLHFADIIRNHLPAGVHLHSLRLHETATSYVEWFESDNE